MRRSVMRPDHRLHFGMIEAQHGKAVERHILDKALEGVAHGVEGAVEIQMIGIGIGDHRDGGRQAQEGAVAFIGFHHHPFARAQPRIGAIGVDDAAIDHGGIQAARIQQRRHQGRGGGLAVGAGDGDAGPQPHDLGQHLGAAHQRQAQRARRVELDIAGLDRRGIDHGMRVFQIVGAVADRDGDAHGAQAFDIGAVGRVASPAPCSPDCA